MPKLYGTPGPRAIMPSMATSHSVAQCDPLAQLLFDRLIGQADDQGRLLGDLLLVKAACMPLVGIASIKLIGLWLSQLERAELIQRYTANGYLLIQIVTWWRWQNGQRRVFPSRYPPPDGWTDTASRGTNAGQTPDNVPQSAGQTPDSRPLARAFTVPVPLPLPMPVPVPLPVDAPSNLALDEEAVLNAYAGVGGNVRKASSVAFVYELVKEFGSAEVIPMIGKLSGTSPIHELLGDVKTALLRERHHRARREDEEQAARVRANQEQGRSRKLAYLRGEITEAEYDSGMKP